MTNRTQTIILIALCCIGFLFRLWIASLVPQPFVYDQDEYYGYALGIIQKGLHADLYRLYGYPLIIAPLIYFFGVTSAVPWTVFHAVIDTITALLVYWISFCLSSSGLTRGSSFLLKMDSRLRGNDNSMRRKDDNSKAPWIAFVLYLFNPFTAGYTGVLLSEVVTVFLVTFISVLLLRFFEKKTIGRLFFLSLLLGFLPQVRPVFILLSISITIVILSMFLPRLKKLQKKIVVLLFSFLVFSFPFWYTIAGNLVYHRQFSVLGVEPTFVRELYASLFIGRGMPFTDTKWGDWPAEAQVAWGAFTAPPTAAGRAAVADQYLTKAITIIKRDPGVFLQSRLAKMGYVWEKHFIYPYVMGKPSDGAKTLTYWGNITLLSFALIGMMAAFKRNKRLVSAVLLFFLYISLVHMFSTSEERFSLPTYPWVMVFAGFGVWRIGQFFGFFHQGTAGGVTSPSLLS